MPGLTQENLKKNKNEKQNEKSALTLNDLPSNVLSHIQSKLPLAEEGAMAFVSKRFANEVRTQKYWKRMLSRYFPSPLHAPQNGETTETTFKRAWAARKEAECESWFNITKEMWLAAMKGQLDALRVLLGGVGNGGIQERNLSGTLRQSVLQFKL